MHQRDLSAWKLEDEIMPERLLLPYEVCTILGLKLSTVYKLVHQQRIGCVKCGNRLRFRPSHVENFIQRRTRQPRKGSACRTRPSSEMI